MEILHRPRRPRTHIHNRHIRLSHAILAPRTKRIHEFPTHKQINVSRIPLHELGILQNDTGPWIDLDEIILERVGHECRFGGGGDGGPAGCLLAFDFDLVDDGGGALGGDGGGAEGGVGGEDVFGAGDGDAAEEDGGAGGGGTGVLGADLAFPYGEHGEEARGVLHGLAFDGSEEHTFILVEKDVGDRAGGANGWCGLVDGEAYLGFRQGDETFSVVDGKTCDACPSSGVAYTGHFVFAGDGSGDGKFTHGVYWLAYHGKFGGISGVDGHQAHAVGAGIDSDHPVAFDFHGRLREEGIGTGGHAIVPINARSTFPAGQGPGSVGEGAVLAHFQGDNGVLGRAIGHEVDCFGSRSLVLRAIERLGCGDDSRGCG